jgi:hypothetical protein
MATSLGDVDGDGVDDVLVTARLAGSDDVGTAFVFSGSSGLLLHASSGSQAEEQHGFSGAALGDVSGDGIPDFIVGAPLFDNASGDAVGRVFVRNGVDGHLLYTIEGEANLDFFGSAVTGLDDLDGDSTPDFCVSSFRHNGLTQDEGRLYFFSGSTGSLIGTQDGFAFDAHLLGQSLVSCPDLNQDGVRDLLAGGTRTTIGGSTIGVVFVLSGKMDGLIAAIESPITNNLFGVTLAPIGDTNGDGVSDLLIGALDDDIVYRYSGNDFSELSHWVGEGGGFGSSVAGITDIDGDGVADVLIGATSYGGNLQGRAYLFSGATGVLIRLFEGDSPNDHLGQVASLGDFNHDGLGEFAVAAPEDDPTGQNSGRVWIYVSGSASWANYGQGFPGYAGVPGLALSANPVLGTTVELQIENSLQLLTDGVLVAGSAAGSFDTPWGGQLLVIPKLVVPIHIPSYGLDLPIALPDDSSLCGLPLFVQAIEFDIEAAHGLSFTPGIRMVLGG